MSHDPTKVLLGGRVSSISDITNELGNPSVFKAGLAVRLGSDSMLSLGGASPLIGVSVGDGLCGTFDRTAVMRIGNFVPLLLQEDSSSAQIGDINFVAKVGGPDGDDITITLADLLDDGSASVVVTGTEIVVSIESGVTTAEAIKDAIENDEDADALVLAIIDEGEEDTAQASAAETPLAGGALFQPVIGTIVSVDDATGKASTDGDPTAATWLSGRLTGVYPDGSTAPCALIDLIGGF